MRPELVLGMKSYSDPAELRDKWLKEYAKYENDISDGELAAQVKARMLTAYDLVIAGKLEDDPSLDGDFPLGKTEDAEFMVPMFRIDQLVLLQLGAPHLVQAGHYVEPAYDVLVRKGILHELDRALVGDGVAHQQVEAGTATHRSDVNDLVGASAVAGVGREQMLDGMCGRGGQIVSPVGNLHADVVGYDVPVNTGDVHTLSQNIVVHGKAGNGFHAFLLYFSDSAIQSQPDHSSRSPSASRSRSASQASRTEPESYLASA